MSWGAWLSRRVRWPVTDLAPLPAGVTAVDVVDAEVWESVGEWGFTHNTSVMIYAVLQDARVDLPPDPAPCSTYDSETGEWTYWPDGHGCIAWWDHLDGMTGAEGWHYLRIIIDGLEADPGRFRALNPSNGWGDYDSLLGVLREMRDACAVEDPSLVWSASG